MLLTNTKVSKIRKAFANSSSANIKLSKTQLHKIGQSGGFFGRLLEPLLKTGLPLIGNVLKPLAETRNYFLEEIKPNELMSKKHKKLSTTPNYIERFLVLASTITGCILISVFASLHGIQVGITSSATEIKICSIGIINRCVNDFEVIA